MAAIFSKGESAGVLIKRGPLFRVGNLRYPRSTLVFVQLLCAEISTFEVSTPQIQLAAFYHYNCMTGNLTIFRIRKGFRSEAKLVSEVLPIVLCDFFSPTDVMNKVIGEFLSSQQPHPELMASVLYKVCRTVQL